MLYSEDFNDVAVDSVPQNLFVNVPESDGSISVKEENGIRFLRIYDGASDYISKKNFMPSLFCESFFERQYGSICASFDVRLNPIGSFDTGMSIGLRAYEGNYAVALELKGNKLINRIADANAFYQQKEVILTSNLEFERWYSIKILADIKKLSFDLFIDGELIAPNIHFWKNVNDISSWIISPFRKEPRAVRYLDVKKIEIKSVLTGERPDIFDIKRKTGKAPYKVLYGNDLTNAGIKWPTRPDDYMEAMKSTVLELSGHNIDACLFQPVMASVPVWDSKFYPVKEHIRWWKETFNTDTGRLTKYVAEGNDVISEYISWCREAEVAPFVSVRLNDTHHLQTMRDPDNRRPSPLGAEVVNRFYVDHPEWIIGSVEEKNSWHLRGFNWRFEGPRHIKKEFIRELSEYDIDGIELDFLRINCLYRDDELTDEQKSEITTGFIKDVRAILDNSTNKRADKRKIWLCVRIPAVYENLAQLGIVIPKIIEAGVDMINVSSYLNTEMISDIEKIAKESDGVVLYREGCNRTAAVEGSKFTEGDCGFYRRTTPLQYYTHAHLAYKAGFDGYSTFNFAYYREHGAPGRGPYNEPPFYIHEKIADKEWVSQQKQHYCIGWTDGYADYVNNVKRLPLPRVVLNGQFNGFEIKLAQPDTGWCHDGKLRVQCSNYIDNVDFKAWFNDVELESCDDVSEFPTEFITSIGVEEQYKAWYVPSQLMRDGINYIGFKVEGGELNEIVFIDLQIDK